MENEEKATVKQRTIQRKKNKKKLVEFNEQYPNIKIKDQRTSKVAKVKKKNRTIQILSTKFAIFS